MVSWKTSWLGEAEKNKGEVSLRPRRNFWKNRRLLERRSAQNGGTIGGGKINWRPRSPVRDQACGCNWEGQRQEKEGPEKKGPNSTFNNGPGARAGTTRRPKIAPSPPMLGKVIPYRARNGNGHQGGVFKPPQLDSCLWGIIWYGGGGKGQGNKRGGGGTCPDR